MFFREPWSEQAFSADMVEFHRSWPDDLGHVACPVTLIQGEQDGNSPFETVQEYCAKYPDWRCISYPEEGAFVAHVRWREVLDLIEARRRRPSPIAPAAMQGKRSPRCKFRRHLYQAIDVVRQLPRHASVGKTSRGVAAMSLPPWWMR